MEKVTIKAAISENAKATNFDFVLSCFMFLSLQEVLRLKGAAGLIVEKPFSRTIGRVAVGYALTALRSLQSTTECLILAAFILLSGV